MWRVDRHRARIERPVGPVLVRHDRDGADVPGTALQEVEQLGNRELGTTGGCDLARPRQAILLARRRLTARSVDECRGRPESGTGQSESELCHAG